MADAPIDALDALDLIAARHGLPGARQLAALKAVTVRTCGGDEGAHAARAALRAVGVPTVDEPGTWAGGEPLVVWCTPTERLLLGHDEARVRPVLDAFAPGEQPLALALDSSEALAVIELHGPGVDHWLCRLVEAESVPRAPQRAGRCRLADVTVLLLRRAADRVWLVVERPLLPYVTDWLRYTHEGLATSLPG